MTITTTQFDYSDFKWRLGENTELMKVVVSEFLNETYAFLDKIESATEAENWDDVASFAHKVKGASSEVSSLHLPSLAKKLELAARAKTIEDVLIFKADLRRSFEALEGEMRLEFEF
ncbi:Hpt domain-containing protein [Marinomonas balearica]|uniref:Hpt domain-containing protein n=1 Tax=Marinomonas balearica TaxID=491947 RepID=A0A4R6M4A3_9GAMM|nr:Hpt domain-containing protein [Marinomonas balearica]TDO95525.1 Hpt domain-containing protein [Marinomonas balearica]